MRVLFPSLLKFRAANYRFINKRHKYIVLLPEIPPDTAETNPLLRKDILPAFSQINVETCVGAIGRLVIEYESGIHQLDQKLYDPNIQSNVQNVILPLDRLSGHLDFAWGAFKIFYTVQRDDRIANAYTKLHARIVKAKRERFLSASIYKAFKELKKNASELTEPVRRIIDKHIVESRLSGMDLNSIQYRQFQEIIFNLDKHRAHYKQKLLQSTAMFSHSLSYSDVENLPVDLLEMLAGDPSRAKKGPWVLTLDRHLYKRFMECCDKRELRWNTWNAWNIRATSISGNDLNNSVEIEQIRYQRRELSKLLGFPTFADLSMQTKMAGSVDNVRTMLTTLHVNCQDAAIGEIETLQAFARENGFTERLELWDISYWQRLHKEALFSIDDAVVRHYFPFPHVLNGVFQLFKKLFRISIKQVEGVDVWHKDVSYYKIYDENDKEIASFFMDPYFRPDGKNPGCWLEVGNNRSDVTGVQPLSYLIFNFFPPSYGRPSLLSFNDIKMLMRKFGHLLQHSLTEIPYSDVSGLSNLEWDVVNVCPLVMESFLRNYNVVANLSSHVDSGKVLPPDIHENIIESENYMPALKLTEELYLSSLDLELCTSKDFWLAVTKKVWSDFMPFPYEKHVGQPCSFPEIFSDVYPAAYFSNLWAKMIAADVFSVFEKCSFEDEEKLQQTGMRFRETYLALGGGSYPGEQFRKFCGRDPSAISLLASYGLTDKKSS